MLNHDVPLAAVWPRRRELDGRQAASSWTRWRGARTKEGAGVLFYLVGGCGSVTLTCSSAKLNLCWGLKTWELWETESILKSAMNNFICGTQLISPLFSPVFTVTQLLSKSRMPILMIRFITPAAPTSSNGSSARDTGENYISEVWQRWECECGERWFITWTTALFLHPYLTSIFQTIPSVLTTSQTWKLKDRQSITAW